MCGRYTLFLEQAALEQRFDASFPAGNSWAPRYNMAPGQDLPVITDADPDRFDRLEWGLVPHWADDDSGGAINARVETVAEKPSFARAYAADDEARAVDGTRTAGRCLVPANGFYEWVETDRGSQPYRVAFEDDRAFAMAGLWERWEPDDSTTQTGLDAFGGGSSDAEDDPNGPLETFTVLTTEPNDLVGELHHRMAVILDPDQEREWLTAPDPSGLLEPYPGDDFEAYPVSTAVNSPATDDPSLVAPLE